MSHVFDELAVVLALWSVLTIGFVHSATELGLGFKEWDPGRGQGHKVQITPAASQVAQLRALEYPFRSRMIHGRLCVSACSHYMGGDEREDDLLSTYPTLTPTGFQDMASFKKSLERCYNDLLQDLASTIKYMAFTNVTLR